MPVRFWTGGDEGDTGGGSPGSVTVSWGPNFGGTDGDQFQLSASPNLDALALEGALDGQATFTFDNAHFIQMQTIAESIADFNNTLCFELNYSTAPHDCTTIAGSVVNQNNLDLVVGTVLALENKSFIAFDLNFNNSINDAYTVEDATLELTHALAAGGAQTISIRTLSDPANDEPEEATGWDETTITGSNEPAQTAAHQTFSVAGTEGVGDVETISLNATVQGIIQDRIDNGTNHITFILTSADTGPSTFEDDESGANGPTLYLKLGAAADIAGAGGFDDGFSDGFS